LRELSHPQMVQEILEHRFRCGHHFLSCYMSVALALQLPDACD
jgi:hypothetical protein